MVYIGKPYFLMDDLGVPLFLETPMLKSRDLTFTAVSSKFDGIEQTFLFWKLQRIFVICWDFKFIWEDFPFGLYIDIIVCI